MSPGCFPCSEADRLPSPLKTYVGKGLAWPGVIKEHHCIAYTGRTAPHLKENEHASTVLQKSFEPIKIIPGDKKGPLDPMTRLNLFERQRISLAYPHMRRFGQVAGSSLGHLVFQYHGVRNSVRSTTVNTIQPGILPGQQRTGGQHRHVVSAPAANISSTTSPHPGPLRALPGPQPAEQAQQAFGQQQNFRQQPAGQYRYVTSPHPALPSSATSPRPVPAQTWPGTQAVNPAPAQSNYTSAPHPGPSQPPVPATSDQDDAGEMTLLEFRAFFQRLHNHARSMGLTPPPQLSERNERALAASVAHRNVWLDALRRHWRRETEESSSDDSEDEE